MQQPYYSQIQSPPSSGPNPLLIVGILLVLVVIGIVIYFMFFSATTTTGTSTATHTSTGTSSSTATHTSTGTSNATHTSTSTSTSTHTSTGTGTGTGIATLTWPRHFHGSSGGIVLDMTVQKVNIPSPSYTFTGTMDESDGPFNISGTLLGSADPRTYTIIAPSSTQFPISLNSTVLSSTQVITLKIPFLNNTFVCCFVDGSTVNSCPSI